MNVLFLNLSSDVCFTLPDWRHVMSLAVAFEEFRMLFPDPWRFVYRNSDGHAFFDHCVRVCPAETRQKLSFFDIS